MRRNTRPFHQTHAAPLRIVVAQAGRRTSWWNNARRRRHQTKEPGEEETVEVYEFSDGMAWASSERPGSTKPSTSTRVTQSIDEDCDDDTFTAAMTAASNPGRTTRRFPGGRHQPKTRGPRTQPIPASHEALDLLRERLVSGSVPSQRKDPFKLGLVVEGGGMRGCVSGGALQAMSDYGLRNAFDAVYGSSAGAINGTYFLSGQRQGVDIYHQHIANTEFIDLKRLLSSKPGTPPALNLGFLLEEVMETVLPLDVNAVLSSAIPLKVVASSLDSLSPVLLENFESKHDLIESLRASACVPKVAGSPVTHRNDRLVDAAVFEAVPFRSAIADGCTHAIVLCTRSMSRKRGRFSKVLEATIKRAVLNPDYMQDAWAASVEYLTIDGLSHDEMLLRALEKDAHERYSWFAGAHVLPLYPDAGASAFSPLCTDVDTIKLGVAEGRRMIADLVRVGNLPVSESPGFEDSNIQAFRARKQRLVSET